jgi:histidinol-phosphate phosphatase family protein
VTSVDVVIRTIGRSSLERLLDRLGDELGELPGRVVVVNDRPEAALRLPASATGRVEIVAGRAAGPAAARNDGWRSSSADWIAFLDDDVLPDPGWVRALMADLDGLPPGVGASQGRIRVPLPPGRRPTDWERNVAGLEGAPWITADMAYRRVALAAVGGFDERFRRAYREDADLAVRARRAGYQLVHGARTTEHPVRTAGPWVSVRLQAGNADDALMRRLHGRSWRSLAAAPAGRRRRHAAITALAGAAVLAAATRRSSIAAVCAAGWAELTAELAWSRIRPGPRTRHEVATMIATSAVIPPVAIGWYTAGRLRRMPARVPAPAAPAAPSRLPRAVLLDRDGTLVVDRPYNGDPDAVRLMPTAARAIELLRARGIPTAVVSNQSGVARGLLTWAQVEAVNRRVDELAGPLGPWFVCPHGPDDACGCRKPAPGLVMSAAEALGVRTEECVVIGDIGADVAAAQAAGARAIMVPTPRTRIDEIAAAPEVADDLEAAVRLILGESP